MPSCGTCAPSRRGRAASDRLRRPCGPEILLGAFRPAALARVARFGDGLLCAAPPSWAGPLFETVARFWAAAGRDGLPRNVAQVNVALGPPSVGEAGRASMRAYHRFTGDADRMAAGLLTDAAALRGAVRAFDDLGVDEVVCYHWATQPDQVDRLADLELS